MWILQNSFSVKKKFPNLSLYQLSPNLPSDPKWSWVIAKSEDLVSRDKVASRRQLPRPPCYGLNVRVSTSKFVCWNLNPQGDGIGKWCLWETFKSWVWSLHERDQGPYKGWRDQSALFSLYEDTMRNQQSATRKQVLPRTQASWRPDLRPPAPRTEL